VPCDERAESRPRRSEWRRGCGSYRQVIGAQVQGTNDLAPGSKGSDRATSPASRWPRSDYRSTYRPPDRSVRRDIRRSRRYLAALAQLRARCNARLSFISVRASRAGLTFPASSAAKPRRTASTVSFSSTASRRR